MADISNVVKNLLGGADAKTIRSIATVVVAAISRLEGEEYTLLPKSSKSTETKGKKGGGGGAAVKKPRRWGRLLEGVDYKAKKNGYALVGKWANCFDLSKHQEGAHVLISIPNWGMVVGKVAYDAVWDFTYTNGGTGEIKHFICIEDKLEPGDYPAVIDMCQKLGLPQMEAPAS